MVESLPWRGYNSDIMPPKVVNTAGQRRGGIYLRLSREAGSIKMDDQLAMCQKEADLHGIEVVRVYRDDGVSSFKFKERSGWTEMLRDVQAGKLNVLVAQAEDRFTRQPFEKETLMALCAAAGVTWQTVSDGHLDPSTSDGEFFSHLRVGLARQESHRKRERVKQRNAERRLRGDVPLGVRPFGYGVPRVGVKKKVRRPVRDESGEVTEYVEVEVDDYDVSLLHPVEAPLIWAAYQYVLDCETGTGLSTIATMFNLCDVKTVNGKPWDLPKIEKVLRRGRNAGFVEHRAKDPATGKLAVWPSKVLDAKGDPVRGEWETIVDEATYASVMLKLEDPERALKRPREARHLMSSLARCQCGTLLRTSGRNKGESAYRCGVHQGASHKTIGLKHVSIRCSELDELASEAVVDALLSAPHATAPDPEANELHALQASLAETNRALARLLDLVEDEDFDPAVVKAKNLSLKRRADSTKAQIAELKSRSARAALLVEASASVFDPSPVDAFGDPLGGRRVSFELAARRREGLLTKFKSLPLDQRRALVRGYLDVTVTHGRGSSRVEIKHLVATALNEPDREGE
jgi:site-specific DNA recombinase